MSDVENIYDEQGISFQEAMKSAGFKNKYRDPYRSDIFAFLELHVEQGKILENEKRAIGIVQNIVAQKRYQVRLVGEPNHAGTTPMHLRKDAVSGAAEMIQFVYDQAKRFEDQFVSTIGKLEAKPNSPNVIAGEVKFTIDIRHPSIEVIQQFEREFLKRFRKIAEKHHLEIEISIWMEENAVHMDKVISDEIEKICKERQIPYLLMNSGAGHDAQIFVPHCPTGLIFVPSYRGISHSPMEYTDPMDLATGIQVLTDLLYQMAYQESTAFK